MTNTDMHEAMVTLAEGAAAPPPDLLDRVEAGHRRRRRSQAVVAAFAAVLVVAAGAWVVWRPVERPNPTAGFRLPELPKRLPLITETWRSATMVSGEVPPGPDGDVIHVAGRLDPAHLLGVNGNAYQGPRGKLVRPGGVWSYAVADRTWRRLTTGMASLPNPTVVAVTGRTLVYSQQRREKPYRVEIWLTTPVGGSRRLVATLPSADIATELYTDGRYAYFSVFKDGGADARATGIKRVSLTDGAAEILPDTADLYTDGSPWASDRARSVFRHLSTGEVRRVVRPAGADKLDCVPAFCLGHDPRGWFVQRVDGTGRRDLPYPGTPRLIGGFSTPAGAAGDRVDSGLLLLAGDVVLDPVRGRYGMATFEPHCELGGSARKNDILIAWYRKVDGRCDYTAGRQAVYMGAAD